MKVKNVNIIMTLMVLVIVFIMAVYIFWDVSSELEMNPDIKEIGGPPVFTDLRLVAVVVVVACIFCGICLKYSNDEKEDEECG